MTPTEENILNRNLTNLSAAAHRSNAPSSNAQQAPVRMQDGKYKCDYCSKTYKANANLQKHINDHHARQLNAEAGNQRSMLSKNVLRTYSIGGNQQQAGGATISSQQTQMSSVQQNKSNLLSTKSAGHPTTRSPASPNMVSHSPNLSPASHINVQSSNQRQIAVGNHPTMQQRTYVHARPYPSSQSQNQSAYHLQQIQHQDTPQSLDIQIPQNQSSASPRSYSSSPVILQQQQSNVQNQQQIQSDHYQQGSSGPNVRPPASRTYTSQQYYERYQNSVQQRRPINKSFGTGNYAYQPKQIKQVFRQSGQDYSRLTGTASGPMNRVNTVSSTGQPVRIATMNTQSGGPMMGSGHLSAGGNQIVGGSSSQMPAYQVRTNFEGSRRSPQVSSGSLSSQLTPLNVNYGNSTTTTTSIDGIQITKVTPSYGNPRTAIRTGPAVRGRLPDNVRGGGQMYGQPRYGGQGMPQYTQRIMRVVQQNPGNPPVLQQQEPTSQRVLHHQPVSSQHSHPSNSSDN
ncbi:hypothetical protein M3Y97_00788000 [Aphelenchoides bicaudatus]|nr:hypothetical protein M3Y97_00788000 [Aphelenchoides bicaudatus]